MSGCRCAAETIFVPEHSLSTRLLDLDGHGLGIVFCVLLIRELGDFQLKGVLANRGVGGVPFEGEGGSSLFLS